MPSSPVPSSPLSSSAPPGAHPEPSHPIRTLIVDDSVVARTVLERILQSHPRFVVRKKAHNALEALNYLSREPVDVVLLDIEMPGESGIAALPAILRAGHEAKVVILSSNCEEGGAVAVEALAIGASDVMAKPGRGAFGEDFTTSLLSRLLRLVDGERPGSTAAEPPMRLRAIPDQALRCIGVGASTGGIHALSQLFKGLERSLGVPVLVTQHLPPSFIPFFASQMARMTELPCKVAEHGEVLLPDHVYIAPGEAHLGCRRERSGQVRVVLSAEKAAYGGVPAVDPMFNAIAKAYGGGAVAVILTGMGRDGSTGARRIVEAGGWAVAQDQASSVVWGMPGTVARAGLASAVLPPHLIMPMIARRRAAAA